MQSCWTAVVAALVILVGPSAAEPDNEIVAGPQDATVLAGSTAHFNCTVSQGWKLVMWALNGVVMVSLTPGQPIINSNRFTSKSYPAGNNTICELIIHSVQLQDAGQVRCSLQGNQRELTALLAVQAVGTLSIPKTGRVLRDKPYNVTCQASDWTPLPDLSWELEIPVTNWSYISVPGLNDPQGTSSILTLVPQDSGAVTCVAHMKGLSDYRSVTANLTVVSSLDSEPGPALPTWAIVLLAVSFSLLLILIIVLVVIFCCCRSGRRKPAPSYLSEGRKPVDVEPNKTVEIKTRGGKENYGYSSDELQSNKIVASLPVVDSEPRVKEHHETAQPGQVPGHHQPHPGSRAHVAFLVASPRTIRNVTLV